MTELEPQTRTGTWARTLKKVSTYIVLAAVGLFIAFCGIKFWEQIIQDCEKEGNSYMFCVATMRYQAAKSLVHS